MIGKFFFEHFMCKHFPYFTFYFSSFISFLFLFYFFLILYLLDFFCSFLISKYQFAGINILWIRKFSRVKRKIFHLKADFIFTRIQNRQLLLSKKFRPTLSHCRIDRHVMPTCLQSCDSIIVFLSDNTFFFHIIFPDCR